MHLIKNLVKSNILIEGFGSLFINIVNKFLLFIISISLFRTLGTSQYGIYSYVQSIIFILIIPAEFGIFNLVVKEIARGVSQKNYGLVKGAYIWASKTGLFISLSIVGISLLIMLAFWDNFSNIERLTFFWGLALVPVFTLEHINSAALQGLKKIVLGQFPKILLFPTLYIIFIFIFNSFYLDKMNSITAMALKATALSLSLVFAIYLLISNLPKEIRKSTPTYFKKAWFSSILPLGLSSGLNIIKTRSSIILLGFFSSASNVGIFQVALSTAELTALVLYITNLVLAPQFSSLFYDGKFKELQRLVTISARFIILYNVIVSLVFLFWGRYILTFFYGPEITAAYPTMLILLIGQMINSLAGSVAYLLNMTGHEHDAFKAIGLSSIISLFSNIIFINYWGINGAALANSLSLMVAQILMFRKVKKRIGINSSAFGKLV
jgi:O-antigen/teichoic acid export membrane protein